MSNNLENKRTMFAQEPRLYEGCGLADIWLENGYTLVEHAGRTLMEVEDRLGLHREIAIWLVTRKRSLDGHEIKFIRRAMDFTQGELGHQLKSSEQTVARWEKGKVQIPAPEAQLLRLTFLLSILKPMQFAEAVESMPKHLADGMEGPAPAAHFQLSPKNHRWKESPLRLAA